MTALVVDTSIAVKWVIDEPDSPKAKQLLADWLGHGMTPLAPMLYVYEVSDVIRQQMRKHAITIDEARDALKALIESGPALVAPPDVMTASVLSTRALEFTHQLNLPAAYDAHYLALAEREGCAYWTADERLWNAVKAALPWVRWLGEYTPAP